MPNRKSQQINITTQPLLSKEKKILTFAKSLRFFYSRILRSNSSFGSIVRKEIRTRPIKWRDKASCRPVVASNNDLFAAKLVIKYLCLFMPPLKVIERKSAILKDNQKKNQCCQLQRNYLSLRFSVELIFFLLYRMTQIKVCYFKWL